MKLQAELICLQTFGNQAVEQCSSSDDAQATLSTLLTYCKIATGITSLFVIPYLCNLSDRIGRKKVLIIVHLSLFFSVFVVYTSWKLFLNYHFLIIGAIFEGIGNPIVVLNLLSAYISDCIVQENRTRALAQVFCGTTLGYILGPIIGSQVYERTDSNIIAPYTACLILISLSTMFVLLVFPESMAKREYTNKQDTSLDVTLDLEGGFLQKSATALKCVLKPIKTVIVQPYRDIVTVLGNCRNDADRKNLINVVIIDVLFAILSYGIDSIIINYLLYKLKVSVSQLGYTIAVSAVLRVISLGVSPYVGNLLGRLAQVETDDNGDNKNNKLSTQDVYVMRLANIVETVGLVCIGLSGSNFKCAFFGVCLIGLGVMSRPNVLAAIINVCPQRDIGKFMGAKGLFEILVAAFGASVLLSVYGWLIEVNDKLSGGVFLVAAVMYSWTVWFSFRFEL